MKPTEKASQILRSAESDLRKLIGEAAESGDYSSVEAIAGWASNLRQLTVLNGSNQAATGRNQVVGTNGVQKPAARTKKNKRKATKKGASGKGAYPKFISSGDALVKIAWSKSQKSEYRHKSPRFVAATLCEVLDRKFATDEIVSMESVLPIKADDGSDVPDYQAYLCLAWFKSIGAVNQKGREGYTQNESKTAIRASFDDAWNNLPEDK